MGLLGRAHLVRAVTACSLLAGLPASSPADAPAMRPDLARFCRRLDAAWSGVAAYSANLKWPNPASKKEADQGCGLFLYQRPDRWLLGEGD